MTPPPETAPTTPPDVAESTLSRTALLRSIRAEWTKLRSVRGWVVGLIGAALVTVLVGLLSVAGSESPCGGTGCGSPGPIGPDGEAVSDSYGAMTRPLTGDGSITARVRSLTGLIPADFPTAAAGPAATPGGTGRAPSAADMQPGLVPWAKAGLMIRASATQGSPYAAIMVTGRHGVRMQSNYLHDTAGSPDPVSPEAPRWLRLTRSGDTLIGAESADGERWTQVGTATLSGLGPTVQAGLFVTSPDYQVTTQRLGGSSSTSGPSQATATFDRVGVAGDWTGTGWQSHGAPGTGLPSGTEGASASGGAFTISGSGDIGPQTGGPEPNTVERSGIGTFAGLIVVIVVSALFITAEYRRGLIRTTLAASPQRGRVLAAKSIVIGGAAFGSGLAAAAVAFPLIGWLRRQHGAVILPVSGATELRVVVGTAAVFAGTAVLALAVGTILRRSAGAVAGVIVVIVLPYILAVASVLPVGPAQWLLRITPAAAFAVQQTIPEYPQVEAAYTPATGYFPLPPWAGLAVLCGWAAAALWIAGLLLRRRDA